MTDRLPDLIDGFSGRRILVIGDPILDGYLEGVCGRVCPEAPAPVVDLTGGTSAPGGAANAAANARALGADVQFLAATGDDPDADELAAVLAARGVPTDHLLRHTGRRTLAKRRVMAAGQMICRLDQGDKSPVPPATEVRLIERLHDLWPGTDAVLLSDYGYGVLTPAVIAALADRQRHHPRVVVADSKRLPVFRPVGPTAVKPNAREAAELLGDEFPPGPARAAAAVAAGPRLLDLTGARVVALTLDADGAVAVERGRPAYRTYAEPRPGARASGAGDTYAAALALAYAAGADTPAAAELAAAAAAVVVGRDGTACCTARELRARAAGGGKVTDREGVIVRLAEARRHGRRVVLTAGCFDLLHRGHITLLNRAKGLGDILVVGVNEDAGVRRVKGPGRPVNELSDRLEVLSALSCVDYLVPFEEDTPRDLIRAVRPDVYAKGGDYTRDRLPEAGLVEALGGEVRILPFVADRSTAGLIEKIRTTHAETGARAVVTRGHR